MREPPPPGKVRPLRQLRRITDNWYSNVSTADARMEPTHQIWEDYKKLGGDPSQPPMSPATFAVAAVWWRMAQVEEPLGISWSRVSLRTTNRAGGTRRLGSI